MAGWDESKHKRDSDGRFAEKDGKSYKADVAKATLADKGVDTKGMSAEAVTDKYNETVGKTGRYSTETGEKDSAQKQKDFSGINKPKKSSVRSKVVHLTPKEYGQLCHVIQTKYANKIPNRGGIFLADDYYQFSYDKNTMRVVCVGKIKIVGNESLIAKWEK